MNLRKTIAVLALVLIMGMPAQAALNGTAIAELVTEAFIIIDTLMQEVIGLVPTLIEMGIMFALLSMIVGFFGLILWIIKKGVGKGSKM